MEAAGLSTTTRLVGAAEVLEVVLRGFFLGAEVLADPFVDFAGGVIAYGV